MSAGYERYLKSELNIVTDDNWRRSVETATRVDKNVIAYREAEPFLNLQSAANKAVLAHRRPICT